MFAMGEEVVFPVYEGLVLPADEGVVLPADEGVVLPVLNNNELSQFPVISAPHPPRIQSHFRKYSPFPF